MKARTLFGLGVFWCRTRVRAWHRHMIPLNYVILWNYYQCRYVSVCVCLCFIGLYICSVVANFRSKLCLWHLIIVICVVYGFLCVLCLCNLCLLHSWLPHRDCICGLILYVIFHNSSNNNVIAITILNQGRYFLSLFWFH
jgi:hypothetical protein